MRTPLIIFISAFLACVCFFVFIYTEDAVTVDVGRVLGADEIADEVFEQKIIRSRLSLSDVIAQEALPVLVKKEVVPLVPQKISDSIDLDLPLTSAIAIDKTSDMVLFSQDADKVVPIASISKLMTALVFLDFNLPWNKEYQIKSSDFLAGGQQHVVIGDILSLKDLFSLSLVSSANTATQALVSATGEDSEEFVRLMNEKAKELGLSNTSFRDPVGFSKYNVSNAREIAELVKETIERAEIREVLVLDKYECETNRGQKRYGYSTNKLLKWELPEDISILGGKTGYTVMAGNCFAGNFYINNEHGIITVALGASTGNERFRQSLALAEWVRDSYRW